MFKNILVPTDGSDLAAKAVGEAIELAAAMGAGITAFFAAPAYEDDVYAETLGPPVSRREFVAHWREDAARILQPVVQAAAQAGVPCAAIHAHSDDPADAIIRTARSHKCDAIVMASHGRGMIGTLFLGSETQKVLVASKIPVVVLR